MLFIRTLLITLFIIFSYTNLSSAAHLKIITASALISDLKKRDDEKKILLFFTSWCPYCKSIIQQVLAAKNEGYRSVVFISLDKELNKIESMSRLMPNDINIYHMSTIEEAISLFQTFGIRYKNSIPYIAVLDEDNTLIKDDLNYRQLYKYLK